MYYLFVAANHLNNNVTLGLEGRNEYYIFQTLNPILS